MTAQITYLPPVSRDQERERIDGANHPFRKLTEEISLNQKKAWTPAAAEEVNAVFDELSSEWNQRFFPGEFDGLNDALERGDIPKGAFCIELGAGTGMGTQVLERHCNKVVAIDISLEMLKLFNSDKASPDKASSPRVRADAAALPFADKSANLAALINMFLFPAEIDRILKAKGKVLWYSSLGDDTPIYLPPQAVLECFEENTGASWSGVASKIGKAEWCVLERSANPKKSPKKS